MTCADYELQIADGLDGRLAPGELADVERHLAGCPSCAAFAASLRALDASVAGCVRLRPLTPRFDARLRTRIEAEASDNTAARRAELKRQIQAEYEATLARMRGRVRSVASVLDALGLGLLAAGTLTAAVLQAPRLIQTLPADVQPHLGSPVAVGASLGTLVVLAAAWFFRRRPARLGSLI